jgi:RluA family pseudouridine synthase
VPHARFCGYSLFVQRHLECRIPPERAGVSLIEFLLARFPYHSRDGWLARIEAGQVCVNTTPAAAGHPLAAGDSLEYSASDTPEPRVNFAVEALFDDRDLLIVNKPPNLPCHPSGRYFKHTLWALLKRDFGLESPALVNRLDRETSGLVVVAKTAEAARNCRTQFAQRRVEKRYVALVEGFFPDALRAAGRLAPDPGAAAPKRRRFLAAPDGATPAPGDPDWAETRFRRLALHGEISEIEAAPLTGRLHQIRATLSACGFPVVGDKVYGVDPGAFLRFCTDALTDEDRRRLRLDRQALHAAGLRFRHPRTGQPLEIEAALPEDMAGLIRRPVDAA